MPNMMGWLDNTKQLHLSSNIALIRSTHSYGQKDVNAPANY